MADDSWTQNRFLITLFASACIMVLVGIAYAMYKQRNSLQRLLQRTEVSVAFRVALASTAAIALVLSVFPRQPIEAGILLYFILWPALGLQLLAASLPWQRFVQRNEAGTIIAGVIVSYCAFHADFFMLQLAGYI